MDTLSGSACRFSCPAHAPEWQSTTALAKLGAQSKRITTTTRNDKYEVVCTTVEEWFGDAIRNRRVEHLGTRSDDCSHDQTANFVTEERYEADGTLVSSDTSRLEADGSMTTIRIYGQGKSATTRIQSGDIEIRATERIIMIETPGANYRFLPFEGTWAAYYKEMRMTLNMESSFLRSPEGIIYGPDGFALLFRNSRLVDFKPGISTALSAVEPEA